MNPAIPELTPEQIEHKFEAQEKKFVEIETSIKKLRAFVETYRQAIAPFEWNAYDCAGPRVVFDCTYSNKDQQKNIAILFGKDGWEREKDGFTCGRINWTKTVDGVLVRIDGAEHLNPNLIKEVKL